MRWSVAWQTAVFGAVTGAATAVVLAAMLGDWLPLNGPPLLPALVLWPGTVVTVGTVATVYAARTGTWWVAAHTLVPLLLLPVGAVAILAGSQWRDRVETTACWVVFAVVAHLIVALGTGRGPRRRAALAGVLALVLAGVVGVQQAAQERWFAAAARDRGVPLVVPVSPGYRPVGVNLGSYTLVVQMSDGQGRFYTAAITRSGDCAGRALCGAGASGYAYGGDVPAGSTLVPVDARLLAGLHRVGGTGEAD